MPYLIQKDHEMEVSDTLLRDVHLEDDESFVY